MSNLENKVYIEGASIAGLTAAARLAKFKYQVTLSGQSYQSTEIDGFTFDHGALFTLPAVFRDFFQKTGKHFGQVLEVKPMDPAFLFNFGEMQINFANLSRNERLNEIEHKLGKVAAVEWDHALKQAEYLWDRVRENYFEWEFSLTRFNP
ncbi:MAG: phytoene desaturase, partial [Candidatus Nanopelagicaceae bacterium]